MMGRQLVSANNLRYERKAYKGTDFVLDINKLTIPKGGVTAIIGPSGCGKSTLLNILIGLNASYGGSVELLIGAGEKLIDPKGEFFPHYKVGRIFQQGHLLSLSTVSANLALALRAANENLPEEDHFPITRQVLIEALQKVELDERFLDRRVWQLSGGQQQRVAVARAMISGAEILVADEPTSNLDPDLARKILQYIKAWCESGTREGRARSVIWVTHHYEQLMEFADRVIVMKVENRDNKVIGSVSHDKPRKVPQKIQTVSNWVGDGTSANSSGKPNPNDIEGPEWRDLSSSVALSLMLTNSSMPKTLDEVSELVSAPKSQQDKKHRMIFSALKVFSEYSLMSRITAAALLFFTLFIGWIVQNNQYNQVILDPSVCSLNIGSVPNSEYNLRPPDLQLLFSRPWRDDIGSNQAPISLGQEVSKDIYRQLAAVESANCLMGPGAWPRRDQRLSFWLPIEGQKCPESKTTLLEGDITDRNNVASIETIIVHRNEPFLQSMTLSGLSVPNQSSVSEVVLGQPGAGRRIGVVLSNYFVQTNLGLNIEDILDTGQICLGVDSSKSNLVPVLGVTPDLPQDATFSYDALIPIEAYDAVFGIDEDARFISAALYFNPANMNDLQSYLASPMGSGPIYRFDHDVLAQLKKIFDATLLTQIVFYLVMGLTLVMTVLMLVASITSFIAANSPALAMQLALGMPSKFLKNVLLKYVVFIAMVSAVCMTLFAAFGWLMAFVFASSEVSTAFGDGKLFIMLWGISILVTGLILLIAVNYSFGQWYKRNKNRVAEVLQSAV